MHRNKERKKINKTKLRHRRKQRELHTMKIRKMKSRYKGIKHRRNRIGVTSTEQQ